LWKFATANPVLWRTRRPHHLHPLRTSLMHRKPLTMHEIWLRKQDLHARRAKHPHPIALDKHSDEEPRYSSIVSGLRSASARTHSPAGNIDVIMNHAS